MNSCTKNFLKCMECIFKNKIVIICIMITLALVSLFIFCYYHGDSIKNCVEIFEHISVPILTFILVIAAWIQLGSLRDVSREKFLLSIDDRYGNKETMEAREIIHIFLCEAEEQSKSTCKNEKIEYVQKKIKEIRKDKNSSKKYICLLNFLDFLETIAYFGNRDFISDEEIAELLGSVVEYYEIFHPLMYEIREENRDDRYCEIEKFSNKIKKKHREEIFTL